MMKRTMVAFGLVAAIALTAFAAFAWGPGWGRGAGPGYGPGYGPGLAGVNLSAEQIAKIQKIQNDRYAELTKLRTEMFTKQAELQVLFREPTLDQAKIAAKGKEIEALQGQMLEKRLAARTAVAEVLTPEQRAQLPAFGPGWVRASGLAAASVPGWAWVAWGWVPGWGTVLEWDSAPAGDHANRWKGGTPPFQRH